MKTSHKLIVAAVISAATTSANATTTVQDAWQLDTTGIPAIASLTTDIGHLNLSGGIGHIVQEVNAAGNPFVGASFTESGLIFSIAYTPENTPGEGDYGLPNNFTPPLKDLELVFSNLAGTVNGVNPITGIVDYSFTPGIGTITLEGTANGTTWIPLSNIATGAPSGGSLGGFFGGVQGNGSTSILAVVQSDLIANLFQTSTGVSLDYLIPHGLLFLDIQTQNTLPHSGIGTPYTCSTFASGYCLNLTINSDGSVNLLVPEPTVFALLGIGALGFGASQAARRRTKKMFKANDLLAIT